MHAPAKAVTCAKGAVILQKAASGANPSSSVWRGLPKTPDEQKQLADYQVLNFPDPVYGAQFQDLAVPGLAGEGTVSVSYSEKQIVLAGGDKVNLRVPQYAAKGLNYGPLDPSTTLSPRIAQPMPGMGLLEAIPEAEILANADPDDKDHDGISGKANYVRESVTWQADARPLRLEGAEPDGARSGSRSLFWRYRHIDARPPEPLWRLHGSADCLSQDAERRAKETRR